MTALKGNGLVPLSGRRRAGDDFPMLRPDAPPIGRGRPFKDDLAKCDRRFGAAPPVKELPLPRRAFFMPLRVAYGFALPPVTFRIVDATYSSYREEARLRTFGEIIAAVERAFAVDRNDLISYRREKWVAGARCVLCALLRDFTDWSLPEIGRRVGGRDHTTILHAIRRTEVLAARAGAFRDSLAEARRALMTKGGQP